MEFRSETRPRSMSVSMSRIDKILHSSKPSIVPLALGCIFLTRRIRPVAPKAANIGDRIAMGLPLMPVHLTITVRSSFDQSVTPTLRHGDEMLRVVRLAFLALAPLSLLGWLKLAGTYSPWRDAIGILAVTVSLFVLQGRRNRTPRGSLDWGSFTRTISLPLVYAWLLGCWITLGALDRAMEAAPLPLTGHVAHPAEVAPQAAGLRIALALSGGGYRAALLHAGVLMELDARGIPISNVSSVSGGSIIGAYVARGGDPAEFVKAVIGGRFRLKRELLSAFNFPRWILPFGSFSRRDVQAQIASRVLLSSTSDVSAKLPALMLAMTDLSRGICVGATDKGYLLAGPVTSRFFRVDEAISIPALDDISTRVSVSGAFPGVFPALQTSARYTVNPERLSEASDVREIALTLVDGGVRDNLGLKLLEDANANARGTTPNSLPWSGFQIGDEWKLDLIIISDGGKSLEADESNRSLISQVMRAIDVTGIETGIVRLMSPDPPKVALSLPSSISFGPDAIIVGFPHPNNAREKYFYFQPQQIDDVTLDRMAALIPDKAAAKVALDNYRRTKGPINLTKVEDDCVTLKKGFEDTTECRWWGLVNIIGTDIENTVAVFRRSETLEDNYNEADANALVRLGRYLVLLNARNLNEVLTRVAAVKVGTLGKDASSNR
jgi:predicted acylesterase/phospholipase RssA